MIDFLVSSMNSGARVSTLLVFAALAGLYSERAGIFDIGLEGKMLIAAFAAGVVAALTSSAELGLLAAILISMLFALVHGFASITQRGNQIVSGVALNFLAAGLTAFLGQAWFGEGGRTPALPAEGRFPAFNWPGAETIREIPVLGAIYRGIFAGQSIFLYLAILAVPLTAWVVYRTRFGLRLRAVGENPAAVDTAGISVTALRYRAVLVTGFLCGIAGAYLSLGWGVGFQPNMTAGRGYIALAALIFAKWRPWPVLWACLLFGVTEAAANLLQGVDVPLIGPLPVPLMLAAPYVLTIILLAGFIGKAVPPRAGGVPYVKER